MIRTMSNKYLTSFIQEKSSCKSKPFLFLYWLWLSETFNQKYKNNSLGGDILLLEAGPTFISRNADNQHSFAVISEVADSKPPRLNKLIPALVLVLAMLIIVSIGPTLFPDQNMQSLLVCGLVTSILMVMLGILSQQECRDAVNWEGTISHQISCSSSCHAYRIYVPTIPLLSPPSVCNCCMLLRHWQGHGECRTGIYDYDVSVSKAIYALTAASLATQENSVRNENDVIPTT